MYVFTHPYTHTCIYMHVCIYAYLCVLSNDCNLIFQSDGDSDPTEDSQVETEAENSTKAVPGCSTSDPGASSELGCQRGADLQENLRENGQSNEAAEEKVQETRTPLGSGGSEAAAGTAAPAASKAHLFIFDRESQDVESQSILAERTAAPARPREAASADSARSLSQMQLEEDRQRLRKLMEETKQVSVQRCFKRPCSFLIFDHFSALLLYDLGLGHSDQSSAEDKRRLL